jgi:hypothetical protein
MSRLQSSHYRNVSTDPPGNGHSPEHTFGTTALMETRYTVGMELNTPQFTRLLIHGSLMFGTHYMIRVVSPWPLITEAHADPRPFKCGFSGGQGDIVIVSHQVLRFSAQQYHSSRAPWSHFIHLLPNAEYDALIASQAQFYIPSYQQWMLSTLAFATCSSSCTFHMQPMLH